MRDWEHGTNGKWVSMGVWTGNDITPYGTSQDIYYGYPVICKNGGYEIVNDIPIDEFSAKKMQASNDEILKEKETLGDLAKRRK